MKREKRKFLFSFFINWISSDDYLWCLIFHDKKLKRTQKQVPPDYQWLEQKLHYTLLLLNWLAYKANDFNLEMQFL